MKQQRTPLETIGLIVALSSLLSLLVSVGGYSFYLLRMNFNTMLFPASSPAFTLAGKGFSVAFWLAGAALVIAAVAAIRGEALARGTDYFTGNKTLGTIAVVAVGVLLATVFSGSSPVRGVHKTMTNVPSSKVTQILQDDVSVDIKPAVKNKSSTSIPVTVTNKRSKPTDYIIIIDAYDRSGYRLSEDSVYTMDLEAHGTQEYNIFRSEYSKLTKEQFDSATFKIADITVVDRSGR